MLNSLQHKLFLEISEDLRQIQQRSEESLKILDSIPVVEAFAVDKARATDLAKEALDKVGQVRHFSSQSLR